MKEETTISQQLSLNFRRKIGLIKSWNIKQSFWKRSKVDRFQQVGLFNQIYEWELQCLSFNLIRENYISNFKKNKQADLLRAKGFDILLSLFDQRFLTPEFFSLHFHPHLQCLKKSMNFAVEMLFLLRSSISMWYCAFVTLAKEIITRLTHFC